jgi:hypothetical protein
VYSSRETADNALCSASQLPSPVTSVFTSHFIKYHIANMQFHALLTSLFIAVAVAQDYSSIIAQIPSCAAACLTSAVASVSCGATDYTCQCKNTPAITSSATQCLTSSNVCSFGDLASSSSPTLY